MASARFYDFHEAVTQDSSRRKLLGKMSNLIACANRSTLELFKPGDTTEPEELAGNIQAHIQSINGDLKKLPDIKASLNQENIAEDEFRNQQQFINELYKKLKSLKSLTNSPQVRLLTNYYNFEFQLKRLLKATRIKFPMPEYKETVGLDENNNVITLDPHYVPHIYETDPKDNKKKMVPKPQCKASEAVWQKVEKEFAGKFKKTVKINWRGEATTIYQFGVTKDNIANGKGKQWRDEFLQKLAKYAAEENEQTAHIQSNAPHSEQTAHSRVSAPGASAGTA